MTSIISLGLSHHSADLSLRERLAVPPHDLGEKLLALRATVSKKLGLNPSSDKSASSLALLSTCNRTEVYWCGSDPNVPTAQAIHVLGESIAALGGLDRARLEPHLYHHLNERTARHAFRVASGLDSMVIGETQILGQMKNAVRTAQDAGTLGSTLQQLFDRSFHVAKRVRSQTELGAHSISMASAAVRLIERLFGPGQSLNILLVGAGEMIDICAAHLKASGPNRLVITNRSEERAAVICAKHGARFMPLAALSERLSEFDVVVSCTASSLPLIGLGAVKRALKLRRSRPMLMVDLAVPRDIEAEVQQLRDVYLYTVDDLAQIVRSGQEKRIAAIHDAQAIVEQEVTEFLNWLKRRDSIPLIQSLSEHAESMRIQALEKAMKLLQKGQSPEQAMEALSRALVSKMLHPAYSGAQNADTESRKSYEQAIRTLWVR